MFTSKIHTLKATLLLAVFTTLFSGCLKNDIPYPHIPAGFSSIEVEHAIQPASIDSINRKVTFYLDESADLTKVKVTEYTLSPQEFAVYWPDSTLYTEGVDLSRPKLTAVHLFQEYNWTMSAVQNIERYFTVEGQIGASDIDVIGTRIILYLPKNANLKRVKVLTMKLGGPEAQYSPTMVGDYFDFTAPVRVDVTEHGRTTTWIIYAQTTESTVDLNEVDAWTNVAWLYASGQDGRDNRFQYRLATAEDWIDVPMEWTTLSGSTFSARLVHLSPMTTYVARALSDSDISNEIEFTTHTTYDIPNGNLDSWWLDGKIWCPWPEGGEQYFDTGNKGATTLGSSNTYPIEDTPSGSGLAACLESRFVGIGVLGKMAAGNLFAGKYVKTDGTNGILDFGRPFDLHPTRLTGYLKYKTAPISHSSAGFEYLIGQPDTCIVWCALIDADVPFEIRTDPAKRHLFDPNASDVVAYGHVQFGYDIPSYTKFSVELEYKDTHRSPRYMLIVASASKYGDYFTGGNGAVLCIDDYKLEFDY